jgi:hypothetical protein
MHEWKMEAWTKGMYRKLMETDVFFSKLAERLSSENDLSDITWALCSSNDAFQKIFLDYCFKESIKNDIYDIEREFVKDNKRPDFVITDNEKGKYLLEVKIKDQDIHEDYKKIFKDFTRAFIDNYPFPENEKNKKIYDYYGTWHELIDIIERKIKNNNGLNNTIVKGYLSYLKSVTNYFKGETMNLYSLSSLNTFSKTIKDIIEETVSKIQLKYAGGDEWLGYKLQFEEENKYFNIWFGIIFDSNESHLYMEFRDDCDDSVKNELMKTKNGEFFKKPEIWKDGRIIVEIENNHLKMLCDTNISYEKQYKILKEYFKEVMKLFLKLSDNNKNTNNNKKKKSMDLSNLYSLNVFSKTIKKIIETSKTISETKPKYGGGDEWAGYTLRFKKEKKYFNIWFGIIFGNEEENQLYMEFRDDCDDSVKNELMKTKNGEFFKKPYYRERDNWIIVEIKDKYLDILYDDNNSYEGQYKILKEYFEEVMNLF